MAPLLADLLKESHVDLDLGTCTMTAAVEKLITLLGADETIRDPQKFLEQVLAREKVSPTIVDSEIAFPHARTQLVDRIILGMGRSQAGIPFGPNGESARLIFLIGVPETDDQRLSRLRRRARAFTEERGRAAAIDGGRNTG